MDTNKITKTDKFHAPIERKNNSAYKMRSGLTYLCFSSDFLLEDADQWRQECWDMICQRQDCQFLFLTKRIERFMDCVPSDWGDGWNNVIVGCTVENQLRADEWLSIFTYLPIKYKNSYRTILEDGDILEMLHNMKEERRIESDYVFCAPTGGILEPGSQRKRLQRLLESCGMEKIRFHDLR